MTTIKIGDTMFEMNKYMRMKTFKKLVLRNNDYDNQWPEFYDNDDGKYFEDTRELKDVSRSLMVIWTMISCKTFKIGIEGTIVVKLMMNRKVNFKELIEKLRKIYGLGKDLIFMNTDGKEYDENDGVYQFRKNLWLGREKFGKDSKCCKMIDTKIRVENNEVELVLDVKVYSIWNLETMCKYISMLTGMKNRRLIEGVWPFLKAFNKEMPTGSYSCSLNSRTGFSNNSRRLAAGPM
jgi:hypothetical protein